MSARSTDVAQLPDREGPGQHGSQARDQQFNRASALMACGVENLEMTPMTTRRVPEAAAGEALSRGVKMPIIIRKGAS